jgi:hypothetical protein
VKAQEYRHRKVRLLRDIETKGGTHFPKGSIMRVDYVERGKLNLSMRNPDPLNIFGPKRISVHSVQLYDVELVES